jgi:hypothetical protein
VADIIKIPTCWNTGPYLPELPDYSGGRWNRPSLPTCKPFFLVELGQGFFEARQSASPSTTSTTSSTSVHRILKCHVLIDLKSLSDPPMRAR